MSKDIVTGIVITSLIFAVSVYLPIIGFVSALFIPLPVLFYRVKLGRANGAMVPIITAVIMWVVIGRSSLDMLIFAELMLLGWLMGELFTRDLSVEKTVLGACGAVLGTAFGCLLFYSNISGTGITEMISAYVAKNLELTLLLYQSMGVSEENIRMISDSMEHIQYVLVRLLPAFAIVSSLFVSWTSLLLARPVLENRNMAYPAFGRLNRWKAPDQLVWGVIVCGLIIFIAEKGMKMMALNGLLVLMTVYFFQGIAVMAFFFEQKRFPRLLRVFLYSLVALQQIVLVIVIGCGFFDMWLNFRKLDSEETNG